MKLIETDNAKTFMSVEGSEHKEKASKGLAGTALGFGIAGTALGLLNGGLGLGGVFGGRNGGCGSAYAAGAAAASINDQYIERKECEDMMKITNAMWELAYRQQNTRFNDAQANDAKFFNLYKSQMESDFGLYKNNVDSSFGLYKGYRDADDAIRRDYEAKFNYLDKEIAVLKATRPYQDALIQCDINSVAKDAAYNLERRTCKMITGQIVLPSTPTVTGYGSYSDCRCTQPAPTPAA